MVSIDQYFGLDHMRFRRSWAFHLPPYIGHIFEYPPFITIFYLFFFSNIIKSIYRWSSDFRFPCWENFTSVWPWIILGFFSCSINYLGLANGYFSTRITYLDGVDVERKGYTHDLERACADSDDDDFTVQLKKEFAQYVANPGKSYSCYSRMSCTCQVFALQSSTFILYGLPFFRLLRDGEQVLAMWSKGFILLGFLGFTLVVWQSGNSVGRRLKRGRFARKLRISALKGAADTYASWGEADGGTKRQRLERLVREILEMDWEENWAAEEYEELVVMPILETISC
jgi:hypothetical protein